MSQTHAPYSTAGLAFAAIRVMSILVCQAHFYLLVPLIQWPVCGA